MPIEENEITTTEKRQENWGILKGEEKSLA